MVMAMAVPAESNEQKSLSTHVENRQAAGVYMIGCIVLACACPRVVEMELARPPFPSVHTAQRCRRHHSATASSS